MKHYIFLRKLKKDSVWGGCENRLLSYFAKVDHMKFRITLATTKDIFSKKLNEQSIPIQIVELPKKKDLGFVGECRHLFNFLKKFRRKEVRKDGFCS